MSSSDLTRRETLVVLSALPLTGWGLRSGQPAYSTIESFLGEMVLTRQLVDRFLDPKQPNWAMFDPELGYRHHDTVMKDGIDGSYAVYTMEPSGERRRVHYRNKPCRINTYGDSFTHSTVGVPRICSAESSDVMKHAVTRMHN